MEQTCQRCHESFREGDRYCPSCGLPQLTFLAIDTPQVTVVSGTTSAAEFVAAPGAFGGGVLWRPALSAALTFGIPAGILCFGVLPLGLLATIAASAWAVALYARRARLVSLSVSMGAQIGFVTGLFATSFAVSLCGIVLWVSRFVLHQGGEWDSFWTSQVEKQHQQSLAQIDASNIESVHMAQSLRTMMLSAEGRAGLVVCMMAVVAVILLLLSMAGGALGARLTAAPRRPGA